MFEKVGYDGLRRRRVSETTSDRVTDLIPFLH
jgi:hypothetical protein